MNRLGLHARPSAMFVKVCSRFKCDIWVEKDGEQVNGKSIMGLMMLAAGLGSKLRITCEGSDAEKALTVAAPSAGRAWPGSAKSNCGSMP